MRVSKPRLARRAPATRPMVATIMEGLVSLPAFDAFTAHGVKLLFSFGKEKITREFALGYVVSHVEDHGGDLKAWAEAEQKALTAMRAKMAWD